MSTSIDKDFTDSEMELIKRFGEALGGGPTPFDLEVEAHLARHEAAYARMRTKQTHRLTPGIEVSKKSA